MLSIYFVSATQLFRHLKFLLHIAYVREKWAYAPRKYKVSIFIRLIVLIDGPNDPCELLGPIHPDRCYILCRPR